MANPDVAYSNLRRESKHINVAIKFPPKAGMCPGYMTGFLHRYPAPYSRQLPVLLAVERAALDPVRLG